MNPRETALRILQEVDEGRKSDESLDRLLDMAGLGRNDRALVRELVSGTLKYRFECDFVIQRFYRHDYGKMAPVLRNILRLGVYQLLHLDRVPASAAVDECVKLARRYKGEHLARLVNGVLRSVAAGPVDIESWTNGKDEVERLSIIFSFPAWLVKRWLTRYGSGQTEKMLRQANLPPATAWRVNRLKSTPAAVADAAALPDLLFLEDGLDHFFFSKEFVCLEPLLRQGMVSVQNPAQGLACLLLSPAPGDSIFDMCAAPGGKATFLAELMQDKGRIVALDRSAKKVERLAANAAALGLGCIDTCEGDALTFDPGFLPNAVLLDAPCTGTGVLGRRAELRWRTGPDKLTELVTLQSALLDRAVSLLPPGGILLYATCSVEPEENEQQIEALTKRHPGLVLENAILTLPGEREGFDGGFAARLRCNGTA